MLGGVTRSDKLDGDAEADDPYQWRITAAREVLTGFGAVFTPPPQIQLQQVLTRGSSRMWRTMDNLTAFGAASGSGVSLKDARSASTATVGLGISEAEAHALFARSRPADMRRKPPVDVFISHSWSASRWGKTAALLYTLHHVAAITCAYTIWLLATTVVYLFWYTGSLPLKHTHQVPVLPYGMAFGLFVGLPIAGYVTVILFGQHVPTPLRSTCFLDKLCVHQSDPQLKHRGIQSLHDVVARSHRILCLWSNDYFHRLWCVAELATFVHEHAKDPRGIVLVPLWKPALIWMSILGGTLFVLSDHTVLDLNVWLWYVRTLGWRGADTAFLLTGMALPAAVVCALLPWKERQRADADSLLSTFRLDDVQVTVPSDREVVYARIASLFGSTGAFEEFVRSELRAHVHRTLGPMGSFRVTWASAAFGPLLWYSSLDIYANSSIDALETYTHRGHAAAVGRNVFVYALLSLLIAPVALQAAAAVARRTLGLPRAVRVPACFVSFMLVAACLVFPVAYGASQPERGEYWPISGAFAAVRWGVLPA